MPGEAEDLERLRVHTRDSENEWQSNGFHGMIKKSVTESLLPALVVCFIDSYESR